MPGRQKAEQVVVKALQAALRAIVVAGVVMAPGLVLPDVQSAGAQAMVYVGAILGLLVFAEYHNAYPSLIECRSAPPYNRIRVLLLAAILLGVSVLIRAAVMPGAATQPGLLTAGAALGRALDFPFSPVRLMMLVIPAGTTPTEALLLRGAIGLAYGLGLAGLLVFALLVRLLDWPLRNGAFNVWVNLPLFDPTAGGDVLTRLTRDAHVNVALGFLLPFLIPAALQATGLATVGLDLRAPLTVTWVIALWGFLPAAMIMRGIALMRVADLIAEKRRRAYRQPEPHPV